MKDKQIAEIKEAVIKQCCAFINGEIEAEEVVDFHAFGDERKAELIVLLNSVKPSKGVSDAGKVQKSVNAKPKKGKGKK